MNKFCNYKRYIFFIFFISLSSCGTIQPTYISGDYLTTEHGTARVKDAIQGAQEYCSSQGKNFKVVGTDCPWRCVSNFECID